MKQYKYIKYDVNEGISSPKNKLFSLNYIKIL